MGTDFVFQMKCTIFWLTIGLRVYLGLYVPDFPKNTSKYFFLYPSTFQSKTPSFEVVFVNKSTQNMKKRILARNNGKLSQKYICHMSLEKFK